jgi:hypothetical protein
MSLSIRSFTTRFTLVALLASLATGGILAGPAMAGSAAPMPAMPHPIDHQLCYSATAKGFKVPRGVVLTNQLSPAGFRPKITSVAFHCNPVQKSLHGGKTFRITNPNAHLLCFRLTAAPQKAHLVLAQNQFGVADLNVAQPNLLCLPSWKSLTGPPTAKAAQPPGLDHFACYPVTVQQGAYHAPAGVMLRDEFARKLVSVRVNSVPKEFCAPTRKTVGKHVNKITNTTSLLCFPVSKTPRKATVYDKNQFGSGVVHIRATSWLCLPTTTTLIR